MRSPPSALSLVLAAMAAAAGPAFAQGSDGDSVSLVEPDKETEVQRRSIDCKDGQSLRDTKDYFIGQLGWEPPEIDWHLFCLCGEASDLAGYNVPGPLTPDTVPDRPRHGKVTVDRSKTKGKSKSKTGEAESSPQCASYEKAYVIWFSGYLSLGGDQARKLGACQDQWFHYRDKAREMTGPNARKKRDGKIGAGAPVAKPKLKLKSMGE